MANDSIVARAERVGSCQDEDIVALVAGEVAHYDVANELVASRDIPESVDDQNADSDRA